MTVIYSTPDIVIYYTPGTVTNSTPERVINSTPETVINNTPEAVINNTPEACSIPQANWTLNPITHWNWRRISTHQMTQTEHPWSAGTTMHNYNNDNYLPSSSQMHKTVITAIFFRDSSA